jgi:hypothetical protein
MKILFSSTHKFGKKLLTYLKVTSNDKRHPDCGLISVYATGTYSAKHIYQLSGAGTFHAKYSSAHCEVPDYQRRSVGTVAALSLPFS